MKTSFIDSHNSCPKNLSTKDRDLLARKTRPFIGELADSPLWCEIASQALRWVYLYWMFMTPLAYSIKTNQAIYQDPFDLAGGGASLTRASQEGVLFANPALMPWGGKKVYRYSGLMPYGSTTSETMALANSNIDSNDSNQLIDKIFDSHAYAGLGLVGSVILNKWALAIFNTYEIDIQGNNVGSAARGPSLDLDSANYSGAIMSLADMQSSWFSVGLSTKYIAKSEAQISFPLADRQRIESLANDPSSLTEQVSPGTGVGFDMGALIFSQGKSIDYRLALKADDLGGTSFSGAQRPFEPTYHVGQGITIHDQVNALHLSLDYRDLTNAYDEKLFRKLFLGAKLIIHQHLGFALGLYNFIPSYGIRFDLYAVKFGITRYSKELTNIIGEKRRNIIMGYLTLGW